ncbi:MAG: type III PLP-dependent enzyme, partial [Pikeienuella sp.]
MAGKTELWESPHAYLATMQPENPVLFMSPKVATDGAKAFMNAFNGLTTYAVKACPEPRLLHELWNAGLRGFDVASPSEIDLIRSHFPTAILHYDNPIKSDAEITYAASQGVAGYSVDCIEELAALTNLVDPSGVTLFIRFKIDTPGAAMSLGSKFGADVETAKHLLLKANDSGFIPALTFHPGVDCQQPTPFVAHIKAAAEIAKSTGVQIYALNIGGGFPANITERLTSYFTPIHNALAAFGDVEPLLISEPGRALAARSMRAALQVKRLRNADNSAFLNDDVYGLLAEFIQIDRAPEIEVVSATGELRT